MGDWVRFPRFVAYDRIARAVGVFDFELHQQPDRRRPEVVSGLQPAQAVGVPASAQNRADGVPALSHLRSNVIDLINDSLAIVGPARSENIVSHALAVQIQLVGSQRSRINSSAPNRLGQAEIFSQQIDWLRRPGSAQRRLADFRHHGRGGPGGVVKFLPHPRIARLLWPGLPFGSGNESFDFAVRHLAPGAAR